MTKKLKLKLRHDTPWGYFSHLWSQSLNFFCLKALGKKWKMTPLLCACAVVITLETQKCRKRAPHSVEFNFFINCDRHKRFSQNERRGADLQKVASHFLIFAQGLCWENSSSVSCGFFHMAGNIVVDDSSCGTSWYELYVWWHSWRWRLRNGEGVASSGWKWVRRVWRWG